MGCAGRQLWVLLAVSLAVLAAAQDAKAVAQTVAVAPKATLAGGNDDISPAGNCTNEIKRFCSDVTPGGGKLAECISDQISESESPGSEEGAGSVSEACRDEVFAYKIVRNTNINANTPLAKACKAEAEKFCNVTWVFEYKPGQIIACLRDLASENRLSPECRKEVFKVQMDAAVDYRADADLHEACKNDAAVLCGDVKPGGGRVQACLRDQRPRLSMNCEEELYRQEKENADDVRLSVRLFANCAADKKKFCQDVEPGMARVKDCLEAHREDPGFSAPCKKEIDNMIMRRVQDFQLDSRLRTTCNDDIHSMCAFIGDMDDMDEQDDSTVIRCLQDYIDELTTEACRKQVYKYQELAAEDVRFNMPLAKACYQDRQTFCSNVPPGSARVIRCLMKTRNKLSQTCRAVLFDEEVKFSQNIDFQYPMKQACTNEINLYCKDVPHGEARVIHCLQQNKEQKDFSKECKQEIQEYEADAASDYRLNYRLAKSCKADISALCAGVCKAEEGQVCGGTVLRCLTDKRTDIKDAACRQEVFYFMKMEVSDYRNDVILAASCHADVEKFCSSVEPGEGRVHECLREHRSQLSEGCRKEELLLEEMEAENIELKPGIMKTCKDERIMFCKGVVPGGARMFRCLAEKMGDPDFGDGCRQEIIAKLQRRQANWKLDPPLRKACKASVQEFCQEVDQKQQEAGLVYKCLISKYEDLGTGCQKELGRALHMAFFVWQPGAILTSPCDDDIGRICMSRRPNMDRTPGAVGTCLANLLEKMGENSDGSSGDPDQPTNTLSDECRVLADIAQPPDLKKAFEASLTVVVLKNQLEAMEGATGFQMMTRGSDGAPRSLTLTGWTALAGVAALLILIIYGAGFAWRQYRGIPMNKDYTLVVKKQYK